MENYIAGYGGHAKVIYQITQEYNLKINGFLNIPLKKNNKPPKNSWCSSIKIKFDKKKINYFYRNWR